MDRPPLTADELEQAVHRALDSKDVHAAVAALEQLARIDLDRGIAMYEMLSLAVTLAGMLDPP